jgi:hypothetical protein
VVRALLPADFDFAFSLVDLTTNAKTQESQKEIRVIRVHPRENDFGFYLTADC